MADPIAQYFIQQDFRVTGIDGSQKMIDPAQSRFPEVQFFVADMRNINLDEKFDCTLRGIAFFIYRKMINALCLKSLKNIYNQVAF